MKRLRCRHAPGTFVVLGAIVALAGCAAVRDITQPFREDPAVAVLYTIDQQLQAVRFAVFYPRDVTSPTGLCDDAECVEWRKIDRGLTLAGREARDALVAVRRAETREIMAYALARQFVEGMRQLSALDSDPTRREVYMRAGAVVDAMVRGLTTIGKEGTS